MMPTTNSEPSCTNDAFLGGKVQIVRVDRISKNVKMKIIMFNQLQNLKVLI